MDIAWIGAGNGSGSNDWGARDGAMQLKEELAGTEILDLSSMQIINEVPTGFAMRALPGLLNFNEQLARKTFDAAKLSRFPVVLGGDHSCAIGTWSGLAAAWQQKLGLLWIDAHMDSHTFQTSESGHIHGMPLAALLGHGFPGFTDLGYRGSKLDPERTVLFGVRCYESGEERLLKHLGVRVYLMEEIFDRGFETCLSEAAERIRGQSNLPFGISLDLDALDPDEVPSVGTPVRQGLSAGEILRAFPKLLKQPALVGFEVVEFNPHKDRNDLGLSFVIELLNMVQEARFEIGHHLPKRSLATPPESMYRVSGRF